MATRYNEDFKIEVIKAYMAGDRSMSEISADYNIAKSSGILRKENRLVVYRFIDEYKEQFVLRWLCRQFKISLNCYYNYLKDNKRDYYEQKSIIIERIKYIYYNNNRTIGYRPMKIFLQRYGIYLSTTTIHK